MAVIERESQRLGNLLCVSSSAHAGRWCACVVIFSHDCLNAVFLSAPLDCAGVSAASSENSIVGQKYKYVIFFYHIFVEWRTNGERSNLLHSTNMCLKISSMHLCSVVCESPAAMMRSLRVWLSVSVYRTLYDPFCPFIIYPWLLVFAFTV